MDAVQPSVDLFLAPDITFPASTFAGASVTVQRHFSPAACDQKIESFPRWSANLW